MARGVSKRQGVRNFLLMVWVLLFPVTMWYFSPYLPYQGVFSGIVPGSLMVFAGMFLLSTTFGRLFCGWMCPAGGIQHFLKPSQIKPVAMGGPRLMKFLIWAPWLGGIVALWIRALASGQGMDFDFTHGTEYGISVARPAAYMIYGGVVFLILLVSTLLGRHGFCHSICWMAPWMVLGKKLGSFLGIPSLKVVVKDQGCTSCGVCSRECPMSIPVKELISARFQVSHVDCTLCFVCADGCPKNILKAGFRRG